MKNLKFSIALITLGLLCSCSPDDFVGNPPDSPDNEAPEAFTLEPVVDFDTANLNPTLSWNAATDPDGDPIRYDVLLAITGGDFSIIAENLEETSFTLKQALAILTEHQWKVVAKDDKDGVRESDTASFTTRNLNEGFLLVDNAAFSRRRSHKVEEYKESFWLIGGRTVSGFVSEVWRSLDANVWELVTDNAAFGNLNGFTTAVFNNELWVIGGSEDNEEQNKVWRSNNGIDWVLVTDEAGFSARHLHTTVVFDNKLWVIGGYDGTIRKNDVWSSADGITWENATAVASFTAREDHASVVFDNKIWVIGGNDGVDKNDVWSTEDGVNWNLVIDSPPFATRQQHTATNYAGRIWIVAGSSGNGIWYSDDGQQWEKLTTNEDYNAISRSQHSTTLANGKLYVIGGDGSSLKNDVWIFD